MVILGRYEMEFGKQSTLDMLEAESPHIFASVLGGSTDPKITFRSSVSKSLDGNTWFPSTTPVKTIDSGNLVRWETRNTGLNHLVQFSGAFDLSSVVLTFSPAGER